MNFNVVILIVIYFFERVEKIFPEKYYLKKLRKFHEYNQKKINIGVLLL